MESFRRDRCQGALLGLWLAPTAIRALNSSGRHQPVAPDIAAAVALSYAQVNYFTASPSTFYTQPWPKALPYWLVSLPVLLRYHDSWQARLQWLHRHLSNAFSSHLSRLNSLTKSEPKSESQVNSIDIAQALLLGDLLQIALRREGSASDLDSMDHGQRWQYWQNHLLLLADRAPAYRFILGQTRSYSKLLADLDQALNHSSHETFVEAITLTAPDQIWVKAVAAAIAQPQSYGLATRQLAHWGNRALVAPVMAGALQGQAALPLLCQLRLEHLPLEAHHRKILNRATLIAAANRLVDQWAGILPAVNGN